MLLRNRGMKIWKYMSGKIRHLENICANISLRNRGKDFPYKKLKCDRHTDRGQTHRHSCLEKALLALKILTKNSVPKCKIPKLFTQGGDVKTKYVRIRMTRKTLPIPNILLASVVCLNLVNCVTVKFTEVCYITSWSVIGVFIYKKLEIAFLMFIKNWPPIGVLLEVTETSPKMSQP